MNEKYYKRIDPKKIKENRTDFNGNRLKLVGQVLDNMGDKVLIELGDIQLEAKSSNGKKLEDLKKNKIVEMNGELLVNKNSDKDLLLLDSYSIFTDDFDIPMYNQTLGIMSKVLSN